MISNEIQAILTAHAKWLLGDEGGSKANLREANLSGANLNDVTGDMCRIRSMHIDTWPIAYTSEVIQIGCQRHAIGEWRAFDDERIAAMERRALEWWRNAKPLVFAMIDAYPAKPQA